jgi:hypothetical protein
MTANLDKWPAFHSTGEDHPPLPLFPPMFVHDKRRDGCPASSTRINLMAIAPYGRRATLLDESSVVVMLEHPSIARVAAGALGIFETYFAHSPSRASNIDIISAPSLSFSGSRS